MVNYQILIGGVDYTEYCALPFKEQYVLDSALDNGVITLPMTKRDTIFKPFTLVTITKDNDTYNMYVASDKMTEIVGAGLYTHELALIEETKLLEKYVVDTNTTTQPLGHDYFSSSAGAFVTEDRLEGGTQTTEYYYSDVLKAIIKPDTPIPSVCDFFGISYIDSEFYHYSITLTDQNGNTVQGTGGIDTDFIPNQPLSYGKYTINYFFLFSYIVPDLPPIIQRKDATTSFFVLEEETIQLKSITDVVNRLLSITETLRASDIQNNNVRFKFNQEQADFYDQRDTNGDPLYPAPEFSMTKSTLRECLDQVGSYIHSIVRLKGDTIYFDKLGGNQQSTIDEDYIGNYETLDCEQYASQLDSIVSNITNIDDEITGTMTEPFNGAYKTVRAESGTIRITDTDAIIKTDYPIEKIEKLECGYITANGTTYLVGDITPYVYESDEYKALSSYEDLFPYSKGYAIYYTQGQPNIKGLMFKLPNAISDIFSNQAILNIISQKLGQQVQSAFSVQNITELQFRLTYYPSTTARVKQSRTDITSYDKELTSIYNQSANKVDSRAYGENLKGTIARLGNIDKFITVIKNDKTWTIKDEPYIEGNLDVNISFTSNNGTHYTRIKTSEGNLWYYQGNTRTSVYTIFGPMWNPYGDYKEITFNEAIPNNLMDWLKNNATIKNNLPDVGSYVIINNEDYYVATIGLENEIDHIKATIGLSKDFNALSKYIGIKNNIRLYEVSEKQSVERFVVYEDYCVIGTSIETDNKDLLQEEALVRWIEQFNNIQDVYYLSNITVARIQGKDKDGTLLKTVDLPVISLGLGNSLWFGCKYEDNYSAGEQSVNPPSLNSGYYRLSQYVEYGDYFGEIESISVKLYENMQVVDNKALAISSGNALPLATLTEGTKIFSTESDNIVIKKDNREQINFNYQIHFVTNDNLIIGTQLAQGNLLIGQRTGDVYADLYVLPNRINKFANDIDLTNATLVHSYLADQVNVSYNYSNKQIKFENQAISGISGKSWVLVDNQNEKLLFGKNIDIKSEDTEIVMPTMTFTHKII